MEPREKLDPVTEAALRSLHDIAVPDPVSWVPQTWGWAVLAATLVVMLALWGLRCLMRYRANAYRREALAVLDEIEERVRHTQSRQEGIRELAELLKCTALAAWPRQEVASLSTASWVRFIETHDDGHPGEALKRLLDDFEYHGPEGTANLPTDFPNDLVVAARQWIERHHVSA